MINARYGDITIRFNIAMYCSILDLPDTSLYIRYVFKIPTIKYNSLISTNWITGEDEYRAKIIAESVMINEIKIEMINLVITFFILTIL